MKTGLKKFFLSGFFFPFTIAFFSPLFADPIYLFPRSVVQNDKVKLSDIARLPNGMEDREILTTPEEPIVLTPSGVSDLLGPTESGRVVLGSNCLVIPLLKRYSDSEILESITEEIISRTEIDRENFRIQFIDEETVFLPPKGVRLSWASFPKKLSAGKKIFHLDVWKDEKKIYTRKIRFLIELKMTAYFVKNRIAKNSILSKEDVEEKSFFTSRTHRDLYSGKIEGVTALASLEEGDKIRKKHVRLLHDVERGSSVEVIYREGGLVVVGKGIAKESGNAGEPIRVRAKSSGVLLKGTISENGMVVIQ
ncbi:MAG: flagellar basal body P-ring formation protein FlgA [Leptospiraceae bacterium]|nr:flagellar basal body P-ring formation protein FlgA [Leptospiraceae bacterium]MCP5511491.1 flagellar basal body P-ring formation protein FlgA [Leptospiraceae bacterium]